MILDNSRIFYFTTPQIKHIYQHDRSIGIDYNQVFATLSNPTSITADSAGNVFVLDHGDETIQKLQLMVPLSKNGMFKEQESDLIPSDMASDSTGRVYVIDAGSKRVQKFTTDGIFVKE